MQHMVNLWNILPQDVVRASCIDSFKRGLYNFMEGKSISCDGRMESPCLLVISRYH